MLFWRGKTPIENSKEEHFIVIILIEQNQMVLTGNLDMMSFVLVFT